MSVATPHTTLVGGDLSYGVRDIEEMPEAPPTILSAANQASYEIVPILDEPVVNRGETVQIDFYFTGDGLMPPSSKLYLNYGGLQLDPKDPGEITTAVDLRPAEEVPEGYDEKELDDGDLALLLGSDALNTTDVDPNDPGVVHRVGTLFFDNKETDRSTKFEPIHSEVAHGGFPPISVELNLDSNIPSGDYEISSVLTYGNDELVKQSKSTNTVHVNSRVEQYRLWIAILGLFLAFAALLVDIPIGDLLAQIPLI